MYCPILKGKQFELAALKELVGHIPANNVRPILEPINLGLGQLASAICVLSAANIVPWVVVNPSQSGFASSAGTDIRVALSQQIASMPGGAGQFLPCIKIIDQNDLPAINLLRSFDTQVAAYVENGISSALAAEPTRASVVVLNPDKSDYTIWRRFPSIILYHDGFDKKARNLDYSVESFYSRLHIDYKNYSNAIGFGDYTVLSERLVEGGGPAFVVTIHLSYIDPTRNNEMYVRHFSSYSDTETQSDPGGKFREALGLLIAYVNANRPKFINTTGLQDFFVLSVSGHFPGLGIVKKLSVKHHIETMSTW